MDDYNDDAEDYSTDGDHDNDHERPLKDGLELWWFLGPGARGLPAQAETTFLAANVSDLSFHLSRISVGVDVAEICGGEGNSSVMAVRRRLRAGCKFDIITARTFTARLRSPRCGSTSGRLARSLW